MYKGCAKKTPNGLYMENKIIQTQLKEEKETKKNIRNH